MEQVSKLQTPSASLSASFAAEYAAYVDELTFTQALRPLSCSAYLSDIAQFIAFAQSHGCSHSAATSFAVFQAFLAASPAVIRQAVVRHPPPGPAQHSPSFQRIAISELPPLYAAASLMRRLSALKNFLQFLTQQGMLHVNFATLLSTPKLQRRLPAVIPSQILRSFLKTFPTPNPTAVRNKLILQYLYALGLRISELAKLQLSSLSPELSTLQFTAKGARPRLIPLFASLQSATDDYVRETLPQLLPAQQSPTPQTPLFPARRAQPFSRVGLWKLVKRSFTRGGIDSTQLSPHTLRHSCATHLIQNGADLRTVQELLGHACIQTTELYTRVMREDLKQAAQTFHPFYA